MFSSFFTLVLSLLVFVAVASASPITPRDANKITLSFAHKVQALSGTKNLAQADRARAKALTSDSSSSGSGKNVGVKNQLVTYVATVGVGSPPTEYSLLIDTGSSNTWVGAKKAYVKTKTSKDTGGKFSVTYGSGTASGKEYKDTVTLAKGIVIENQYIGVASNPTGFDNVDGILGIGPTGLTAGTITNKKDVNTVTDNLFKNHKISSNELGIFFQPATASGGAGEMTYGGIDSSKIVGTVHYAPITTIEPAGSYWGIKQTVSYGSTTILHSTAGIVDTGTTLCLLATDAFNKYKAATGGVLDSDTGLLSITPAQYKKLQPLKFKIGSQYYPLSANAQIWPRSLNEKIGGTTDKIYLIVSDLGTNSGAGLDFINGYTFLERYYSVYDTANKRVGFAPTHFTDATTN